MPTSFQQKRPFAGGDGSQQQNKVYGTYQPIQSGLAAEIPPQKSRSKAWWILPGLALVIPLMYFFVFYVPNLHPAYIPVPDLILFKQLGQSHLPSNSTGSKLILIGDVHGMIEPLRDLLREADYQQGRDHVVFLGDFISKGEGSVEVLELAMEMNASCVRGNHEDQILELYADHYGLPPPRRYVDEKDGGIMTTNTLSDEDPELEFGTLSSTIRPIDRRIARSLTPEHIRWISRCPVALKLGHISEEGYEGVGVHAGLQWNIKNIADMDPWHLMTMRTLMPPNFTEPREGREGSPWANQWNKHQRDIPPSERRVVYYGHDAHQGLNLNEYSWGLDTACIKGRQLTSVIVRQTEHGNYTNELFSVSCAPHA